MLCNNQVIAGAGKVQAASCGPRAMEQSVEAAAPHQLGVQVVGVQQRRAQLQRAAPQRHVEHVQVHLPPRTFALQSCLAWRKHHGASHAAGAGDTLK